jgi:hypothetical protein
MREAEFGFVALEFVGGVLGVGEFAVCLVVEAGGDEEDEVGEGCVIFDVEGIDGQAGPEGGQGCEHGVMG